MCSKRMLFCVFIVITFIQNVYAGAVFLDESFSVSGQSLTSDPALKYTLHSGNAEVAHFREGTVGGRKGMFAEFQMVGTSGNQVTRIRRAFDLGVNYRVKKYSCSFDIYVDRAWEGENDNYCQFNFTHDNTQLFAWDVRGHSSIVRARRASDSAWVQKFTDNSQSRPSGWDRIEFRVEAAAGAATLTVYRNGTQLCQYSGADAIGLVGDENAPFVNGMEILTAVQDAGPANGPKIYIDNLSVKTLEPVSYFPAFNKPSKIYVTNYNIFSNETIERKYIALTLAGIMCKQDGAPRLCFNIDPNPYNNNDAFRWEQDFISRAPVMGIAVEETSNYAWGLVSTFKSYISGYVVYHLDPNLANNPNGEMEVCKAVNLAGRLNAIPVADTSTELARAALYGLVQVGDVRNMTEKQVFDTDPSYWTNILIGGGESWTTQWWHAGRYDAVARKWFIVNLDAAGWTADRLSIIDRVPNEQPVYGWTVKQNEDLTVGPMTRRGFSILSPGSVNGPVLQLLQPGSAYPYLNMHPKHRSLGDIVWEDNVHYVCMTISDTGNINSFWRGWPFDPNAWASPNRTDPARDWGLTWNRPMGLGADMLAADYNYLGATSTKWDYFASDCSGYGGYYYPDWYGTNRTSNLQSHIIKDRDYSEIAGQICGLVMFKDYPATADFLANNFPMEFTNATTYPVGFIGFKYVPYAGFAGTLNWKTKVFTENHYTDNIPVVGIDYFLYRNFKPQQCVDALNAKTVNDPIDNINDFSYVLINGLEDWDNEGGEGTNTAKYIADRGNSSLRFVTLEEYFLQLRLRLKTRETLSRWFDQLQAKLVQLETISRKPQVAISYISSARTHLNLGKLNLNTASANGQYSGWLAGKNAYLAIEKARLCMHSTVKTAANTFNLNIPQPVDQMFYLYPYQLSWISNQDIDLKYQLQDRFILKAIRVQESSSLEFSSIAADYTITSLPIKITGSNQYIRVKVQSWLSEEWSETWYNFER